jgi:hypothetical protein
MAMARRRSDPGIRIIAWARGSGAAHLPTRSWLLVGKSLAGGAVLTGLVLLVGSVPASAQALTWSVVPSPDRGTSRNILQGVSCNSATSCTAVGYYYTGSRVSRGLIESWNGTRWSLVPSPQPGGDDHLYGVSCTSATACVAVGSYYNTSRSLGETLIESWDGTRWSVVPSPNQVTSPDSGNGLAAVSCASATMCMAVGTYSPGSPVLKTLFESWDGTRWSIVPSPSPGSNPVLDSISCGSATACMAAGTYYKRKSGVTSSNLVESWDGTRWSVVPSPNRAGYDELTGVSCVSAASCMAVGSYDLTTVAQTVIESWDGTRWSLVPSPNQTGFNQLYGVSCTSAATCTAVGYYNSNGSPSGAGTKTLMESWDGTHWSLVSSPSPASSPVLNGISCVSAAACTAAGMRFNSGVFQTLIESGTASG